MHEITPIIILYIIILYFAPKFKFFCDIFGYEKKFWNFAIFLKKLLIFSVNSVILDVKWSENERNGSKWNKKLPFLNRVEDKKCF